MLGKVFNLSEPQLTCITRWRKSYSPKILWGEHTEFVWKRHFVVRGETSKNPPKETSQRQWVWLMGSPAVCQAGGATRRRGGACQYVLGQGEICWERAQDLPHSPPPLPPALVGQKGLQGLDTALEEFHVVVQGYLRSSPPCSVFPQESSANFPYFFLTSLDADGLWSRDAKRC